MFFKGWLQYTLLIMGQQLSQRTLPKMSPTSAGAFPLLVVRHISKYSCMCRVWWRRPRRDRMTPALAGERLVPTSRVWREPSKPETRVRTHPARQVHGELTPAIMKGHESIMVWEERLVFRN